jgi:hypothetical protein
VAAILAIVATLCAYDPRLFATIANGVEMAMEEIQRQMGVEEELSSPEFDELFRNAPEV